jgi:hypothetical protein
MEEAIPLSQGDLHWVFPVLDDADADAVRDALAEADALMRRLADHLGVRASWTGSGFEFLRVEGFELAGVFGFAEVPGVSFAAELCFPRRCLWDLRWGPPWQVEAVVVVSCVRDVDCGSNTVAELARSYDSPADAARGLVEATEWLHERGVGEPPSSWRSRDDGCGHGLVE